MRTLTKLFSTGLADDGNTVAVFYHSEVLVDTVGIRQDTFVRHHKECLDSNSGAQRLLDDVFLESNIIDVF